MRSLCVFCAAREGHDPGIIKITRAFGAMIAERGITLVYGGGGRGLMGTLADGALEAGGAVVGVIPRSMVDHELAHPSATEMHVVDSMAQRKIMMMELADAFCALPGGIGTLDELFEVMTSVQLRFVDKPMGVLNHEGFFDPQIEMLDRMVEKGFLFPATRERLSVRSDGDGILAALMCR